MEYSHNQYGDVFADIYDDWYHDLDNISDVVEFVLQLAENSAVLELGVGTGRLAIPIAQIGVARGVQVVGIDSSQAMLDELRAKPDGALVCKVFHGSGYSQLAKLFKDSFRVVKPIKPKASRDKSAETFLVGLGPKARNGP